MTQKTNLNVTPYYDDFDEDSNYHRVLFRPGFAVQARELTTLQTILQNQIERFGQHIFKEGSIVIPGHVGYDPNYYAVKLQSTFGSDTVSDYLSSYVDSVITGATSGVKAKVIGYAVATSTDPDTLFVKYTKTASDNATKEFTDGESISSNGVIDTYLADVISATLNATSATVTGCAVKVEQGIFFVRGSFVQCVEQTVVLDKYTNTPSYRVGFDVLETLETPEGVTSLLDNAQGSSNFAAKGAHRFKITLSLVKKTLTDVEDTNFIELVRVEDGTVRSYINRAQYSVIEQMIARRTSDESGDYIVKDNRFELDVREHLNDGSNWGVYTSADGGDSSKYSLAIGPGKAYIKGHEVETIATEFINIDKPRDTKSVNNDVIPFNLGSYVIVDNVYGQPDISLVGTDSDPFKEVLLYDAQKTAATTAGGALVGKAKSRGFEYRSGTIGSATAQYGHFLFDINMIDLLTMSANQTLAAGSKITGSSSGATAYVTDAVSADTGVPIIQKIGNFTTGESITSSSSSDAVAGTVSSIDTRSFNKDVKGVYMTATSGAGSEYLADAVLSETKTLSGTYKTETGTTNATSLLAEALDSSETGVDVDDGTEFSVDQVILVGTEQMKISAISTNTLTVTRGFNGSTAATHADNAQVELLDHLIGISGYDTAEVVVGDILTIPTGSAGATQERTVMYVGSTYISFTTAPSTDAITTANVIRNRIALKEQEELVTIYKLPKDNVKTLLDSNGASDTTYTVRRQFIGTTGSSGEVSFTATSGETFDSYSTDDYNLTVLTAGSGSASAGQVVDISSLISGTDTATITITSAGVFGNAAEVKLLATITKSVASHKSKTANKMTVLTVAVDSTTNNVYGQRVGDKEISLRKADVYGLQAIYESAAIGTTPNPPTLTVSGSGSFITGETITGSVSGSIGKVISGTSTLYYVVVSGIFSTLDTITGTSSGTEKTVTAVATGDTNVLSNFLLDTGQRDSYYDIGRLVRKPDSPIPSGQLKIVYDYFSHGSGDYSSVDSYTSQVDYGDIPDYNASNVDPDTLAPRGFYELRDSLDFRPRVADIDYTSAPTIPDFITNSRGFEDTGSAAGDMVKIDDNIRVDYDFYLHRMDSVYVTEDGYFEVVSGVSAEDPLIPSIDKENSIKLADLELYAYGYVPEDVTIDRKRHKGYQMSDIAKLDSRIGNLEYYTSLGLLETQTETFEILDANGLNRFKSGFIVDNFQGHGIGQTQHSDYKIAVDPDESAIRPEAYLDNVGLIEENTTDDQRTSDGYQKTGDLITLPYTNVVEFEQPYASRIESVNPFALTFWKSDIVLTPETDDWIDTVRIPSVTVNVEGNYEQLLRQNADRLGTVWGGWNTTWTGNARSSSSSGIQRNASGSGSAGNLIRRVSSWSTTVDVRQRRTGVNTTLVERVDNVSTGDRVTDITVIPWIRSRDVQFHAENSKPNSRQYAFFDGTSVSQYCKPTQFSAASTLLNGAITKASTTITVDSTTDFPESGTLLLNPEEQVTYSAKTSTTFTGLGRAANGTSVADHADNTTVSGSVLGMPLISNTTGQLVGIFTIPNTTNARFKTGQRVFRLSDSSTDSRVGGIAETAGEMTYLAIGHQQTKQELIMAVRNATVTHTNVAETRQITQTSGGQTFGDWFDPLAQTIQVANEGGIFLTKIDVYFYSKDDTLPVTLDLRAVAGGYPTRTIIPFSTVVKQTGDVNTSADATTATTFTFPSPVYIQANQEYCIVLRSVSVDYKVWVSRLGETDIGGSRAISDQPYLGTLFKSQNASTWTPSQYEDLKFKMYRAKFTTGTPGNVTLVNEELTTSSGHIDTLVANPLYVEAGAAKVKIKHKNHGMHHTTNNVTISDVISDVSDTLLNGAITNSSTSIVCDSVALFPTSGSIKIDDEIITYTGKTGTTTLTGCTRGSNSTTAILHQDNSDVALYMFAGIPLTEINKTHTSIESMELDSYVIATTTTTTITAGTSITGGGSIAKSTRNLPIDTIQVNLQKMEPQNTSITASARITTGTSISGSETPFSLTTLSDKFSIPLDKDYNFSAPSLVASQINETNEMLGNKSLHIIPQLTSTVANLSPVIDTQRMSVITIGNRLNQIDSSYNSNVRTCMGEYTNYYASTEPTGDNNSAIYLTKKIVLENPATAIKVMMAAVNRDSSDIEVMYKILRTDSSANFDDLDWVFFNDTGVPDSTISVSKDEFDFKDYKYTAGERDDGTGTSLDEFIAFSIKIILKGTNSSQPPLITDFRAIALAT
jgi:hypothetical protein